MEAAGGRLSPCWRSGRYHTDAAIFPLSPCRLDSGASLLLLSLIQYRPRYTWMSKAGEIFFSYEKATEAKKYVRDAKTCARADPCYFVSICRSTSLCVSPHHLLRSINSPPCKRQEQKKKGNKKHTSGRRNRGGNQNTTNITKPARQSAHRSRRQFQINTQKTTTFIATLCLVGNTLTRGPRKPLTLA